MSATAQHPFGSPLGSSTGGKSQLARERLRSVDEVLAESEPEEIWINVWMNKRSRGLDSSSIFESEADALADASRASADWLYLYTTKISKTGNPKARHSCTVDLREER